MSTASCDWPTCSAPAVESCTDWTLADNPCTTLRCGEHRCGCFRGERRPLAAPSRDGGEQ